METEGKSEERMVLRRVRVISGGTDGERGGFNWYRCAWWKKRRMTVETFGNYRLSWMGGKFCQVGRFGRMMIGKSCC